MDRTALLRRLEELERKLTELRRALAGRGSPKAQGPPVPRLDKEALKEGIDRAFRALGARTTPPPEAEWVQERLLRCGVDPEANAFSRGILEMRGEEERPDPDPGP